MTNEDLFICPLCGGEPKVTEGLVYTMIKCQKCGLNLFDKNEKRKTIIRKWNKRVLK